MVCASGGFLEAFDGLRDHSSDAGTLVFCHCGCGAGFVEEDGAIDNVEVIGGRHVAECFWLDEVVEGGEERFGGVKGFVDEARIGG